MKELLRAAQCAFSVSGGLMSRVFGECDGFFYALVAFVIADYVTGIMAAIVEKRLSSAEGFKGIMKKICLFILVAVANMIDMYIIRSGAVIRTAIIFFYLSNEGISVLENAVRIGLPVPEQLRRVLIRIGKEAEEHEN